MLKTRSRSWLALAAAGLMAVTLAGCSGDDGAAGANGAPGPAGPAGPAGPTGPTGPGAVNAVNLATIAAADWESAQFKSTVTSVSIAGKPVVEFTLTNAAGDPVVGLEKVTSKAATASVASYPNLSFALAKLIPRTDADPSKWVSYIVTTVPTTTATATMTRPSTDNTGTLEAVANKPGSYKYTFYRDITAIKAFVAANAASAAATSANNRAADLGDLTYEPTLPHRLTIQIGGAAPGTGSNTPTGVTVAPTVNLANAVNVVYDFIPSTGQAATAAQLTREDIAIATCNVCHDKLAFHGGSARVETKYCVVCHTEQRAYGQAKAVSTDGKFPVLTETKSVNAVTGITSYSYSPNTYVADGEVAGNFVTMIHKIHNGTELVKDNYHYAGIAFNNKGFSKLGGGQRMCTTCHAGAEATTADNYKKLPARESCGACHDGIDFATGTGSTLADKAAASTVGAVVARSGHFGNWTDDKACALCHTPEAITISHRMENVTKNNPTVTAGLASFTYEIRSVTVNAANDVLIDFGIKQRIAPSTTDALVTLATPAPGLANPLAGFTGGPSFLLAYALAQDGVAAADMVDYNNLGRTSAQPISVSIASLLNTTTNAALGSIVPASTPGYYLATIKGTSTSAFPAGAKLRAVAMQAYFTQVSAPATAAAPIARHAISVVRNVTGDTVRRTVVDDEKCSNCHEWFEGHGGNRVKETQVCVVCHVPGLATSGRGIADSWWALPAGGGTALKNKSTAKIVADWTFFDPTATNAALKLPVVTNNFKEMIHGIHAGRERVKPFQDARDRTSATGGAIAFLDFRRMDFPGRLANCEDCHASTDSSATKTYNSIPMKALVTTDESVNAAYAAGITAGTATPAQAKASLATASDTDIVSTPFAGACSSCHDNAATKSHIQLNGGVINGTRAAARNAVESCSVCHGPGSEQDAAAVHKR